MARMCGPTAPRAAPARGEPKHPPPRHPAPGKSRRSIDRRDRLTSIARRAHKAGKSRRDRLTSRAHDDRTAIKPQSHAEAENVKHRPAQASTARATRRLRPFDHWTARPLDHWTARQPVQSPYPSKVSGGHLAPGPRMTRRLRPSDHRTIGQPTPRPHARAPRASPCPTSAHDTPTNASEARRSERSPVDLDKPKTARPRCPSTGRTPSARRPLYRWPRPFPRHHREARARAGRPG